MPVIEQTDLFDGTHTHRGDPATSLDAATMMRETGTAESHCKRIIQAMKSLGESCTGPEIAAKSGIQYEAVMRRMHDLEEKSAVSKIGKRGRYMEYELNYWGIQ